jgi:hypothetical protein
MANNYEHPFRVQAGRVLVFGTQNQACRILGLVIAIG